MKGNLLFLAALGIVAIGIYLAQDIPPYAATTSAHFPAHRPAAATAPARLWENGKYAFGRWTEPVHNVSFHYEDATDVTNIVKHAPSRFMTKHWHYTSVNTPDYLVAIAVVSLQYVTPTFVYLVDKKTNEKWEFGTKVPLSIGATFATSSVDPASCTTSQGVSICYRDNAWHMKAENVPVTSDRTHTTVPLSFDFTMTAGEPLILSFPLANDPLRPAYVHKGAGNPVTGDLTFDSKRIAVPKALGAVDWTKSISLHRTEWNWVSINFVDADDGKAIGINLSARVYDVDGASQENAVWVDGQLCLLGGVTFNVPSNPVVEPWTIRSSSASSGDLLDLVFTPVGSREEKLNVLNLIRSDFVQPYGRFSGRITCTMASGETHRIRVEDAFGVVEDHFALW
ncbi:Aste57867_24354 [Aphanomyces stellatus]|uniref:Aste57867_24354 protein n=1 Tax=Aphanomyces stellatus TaxID=120398 RepID=A0A485LQ47_9STRA|nr:hypothetical protein As57867_024278 [Aphanomyces stellatus]VFU00994.1 Aste57867_24354 [Aphanomyces stellatus]